jgi:DNA mismatch repair ATPase MutS
MTSYGIDVAATAGLAREVVQHAHVVRARLEAEQRPDAVGAQRDAPPARQHRIAGLALRLDALRHSSLAASALRSYLAACQADYAALLSLPL